MHIDDLAAALAAKVQVVPVPLLVFRVPGERRRVMRTFSRTCTGILRRDDLVACDPAGDRYLIAMTSGSRSGQVLSAANIRALSQRIAAMMSVTACAPVQTGWTLVKSCRDAADICAQAGEALERGTCEREGFDFFAAVGHELRTPLTSIRGYLETLLEGRVDAPTARRFLEIARAESLRMSRLVDGMCKYSLLDLSGEAQPQRRCSVGIAIDLVCDILRPLAQQRGVFLRAESPAEAVAAIESDACIQLLINLVENAVKYGRTGGSVEISTRERGETIVMRVDDDGPGIPAEQRHAIFRLRVRGQQGHGRPGTGIGLTMVKMIAEREGGHVRVVDSPLGGARFEVMLPRWAESGVPVS